MDVQREMTLDEWCERLPSIHLVNKQLAQLRAENAALREQLAAAQKYAERYRWLRDGDSALEQVHEAALCLPEGDELDAAIDAAREKEKAE